MNKAWGALTVNTDGTWFRQVYASGADTNSPDYPPMAPDLLAATPFPVSNVNSFDQGTWKTNSGSPRLDVTVTGGPELLRGLAFSSADAAVFC